MKEKARARFNIIDFLIIIAVLASLFVLIFRRTIVDFIGNVINTQEAVVTVRVQGVERDKVDMLKTEDVLYWNGELFGSVTEINILENKQVVLNESGVSPIFVETTDPELCDIECRVSVKGAFYDDGFRLAGSYFLGVGKTVELYTDGFYCSAIITSIA